jgi:5-methylcytosine-specific restriction endonuclease McrA
MNKKEYGENWEAIRNRTLDRDNRECKHCHIKDKSWVEIIKPNVWVPVPDFTFELFNDNTKHYKKIFLQVAHKDNNKENMSNENLLSLCNLCHLKMDAEYKKYKRLSKNK